MNEERRLFCVTGCTQSVHSVTLSVTPTRGLPPHNLSKVRIFREGHFPLAMFPHQSSKPQLTTDGYIYNFLFCHYWELNSRQRGDNVENVLFPSLDSMRLGKYKQGKSCHGNKIKIMWGISVNIMRINLERMNKGGCRGTVLTHLRVLSPSCTSHWNTFACTAGGVWWSTGTNMFVEYVWFVHLPDRSPNSSRSSHRHSYTIRRILFIS